MIKGKNKNALLLLAAVVLFVSLNHVTAADKNAATAADKNATTTLKVIKEKPIIIHTQAQIYEQPTLNEYQSCHENLDKCLKVCETASNATSCMSECPRCPILIDENIMVQGINDTEYRAAPLTSLNTTNIIRLTNEIRNIIDNNMGNITTRNENNINVHQNITHTGGKFGLGTSDKGPCCLVVRATKSCHSQTFSTAERCHHKRFRACSQICKSHTMLAKRELRCNDEEGIDCSEGVTYIPYESRHYKARPKCRHSPRWPFVSCAQGQQRQTSVCQRCLSIPYYYVLRNGVPAQCSGCFHTSTYYGYNSVPRQTTYWNPPVYQMVPPQYPMYNTPVWDMEDMDNDGFASNGEGWNVEQEICRRSDGSIDENCLENGNVVDEEDLTNQNDSFPSHKDPLEELPEAQEEFYPDDDDNLGGVEAFRRRRNSFRRSIYSNRTY